MPGQILYGLFRIKWLQVTFKRTKLVPANFSGPNFSTRFPVSQTFHKGLLGTNCYTRHRPWTKTIWRNNLSPCQIHVKFGIYPWSKMYCLGIMWQDESSKLLCILSKSIFALPKLVVSDVLQFLMSKYPLRFVNRLTSGGPGKKTSHSRDLQYFDILIWLVYNDKIQV